MSIFKFSTTFQDFSDFEAQENISSASSSQSISSCNLGEESKEIDFNELSSKYCDETLFNKDLYKATKSTPVQRRFKKLIKNEPNVTQLLNELNNSLHTNHIDKGLNIIPSNDTKFLGSNIMKEPMYNVIVMSQNYQKLSQLIEQFYLESSNPMTDERAFSDPINRLKYLLHLFQNNLSGKERMKAIFSLEKRNKKLNSEKTDLEDRFYTVLGLLEHFVAWLIETENYLKALTQDFNIDFSQECSISQIDPLDEQAVRKIVEEYMNLFLHKSPKEPLTSLTESSPITLLEKNITFYCRSFSKKISELMYKNRTESVIESNIDIASKSEKSVEISNLKSENKELKTMLENAQSIILSKYLPDKVIEALNEVEEVSIKEKVELDKKYILEKENWKAQTEKMTLQYEEQLEKKNLELIEKDIQIKELQTALQFSKNKNESLINYNKELARDSDDSSEKLQHEIMQMKNEVAKLQNKCCSHCNLGNFIKKSDKSCETHVETVDKSTDVVIETEDKACMVGNRVQFHDHTSLGGRDKTIELEHKIKLLEATIYSFRGVTHYYETLLPGSMKNETCIATQYFSTAQTDSNSSVGEFISFSDCGAEFSESLINSRIVSDQYRPSKSNPCNSCTMNRRRELTKSIHHNCSIIPIKQIKSKIPLSKHRISPQPTEVSIKNVSPNKPVMNFYTSTPNVYTKQTVITNKSFNSTNSRSSGVSTDLSH